MTLTKSTLSIYSRCLFSRNLLGIWKLVTCDLYLWKKISTKQAFTFWLGSWGLAKPPSSKSCCRDPTRTGLQSSKTSLQKVSQDLLRNGFRGTSNHECRRHPFPKFHGATQRLHLLFSKVFLGTFRNDLLAAVEYLVNVSGIRSIVVETNGVADPANV